MADIPIRTPSRWRRRDVLLVAGSLYLLAAGGNLVTQELRLQRYAGDLRTQRQAVEGERKTLNRQLELYKQDAGIERLARQHLGMARADELPVRFVDATTKSGQPAAPSVD
ncbi:MAG: septum formation initiator family protein [Candidatus Sericytochromatia bacterium]|nr:septum formation initiator family protein [Candidatus Sericytochromatia bacterium]